MLQPLEDMTEGNLTREDIECRYPFVKSPLKSYGSLHVISQYLSIDNPPADIRGEWQHGHIEPGRNIDPDSVIGGDGVSRFKKNSRYYVAREDQKNYLNSQGYDDVHDIGLPLIYVPQPAVSRVKNSLLVMPFHSIGGMKMEREKLEDEYLAYIDSVRGDFSEVICCLHRNDYDQGGWNTKFAERGLETVVGGDPNDGNTYFRLAYLFSRFEYVTGNSWGSHLAYAAYYGAKSSIAGPSPKVHREAYENLTYFKNKPRLLDLLLSSVMEEKRKVAYPFLWCDPWKAEQQIDWAKSQLGESSRLTREKIRQLFDWPSGAEQTVIKLRRRVKKLLTPCIVKIRRFFPRPQEILDPRNPDPAALLKSIGVSFLETDTHLNVLGCDYANFSMGLQLRKTSSDARVYEQVIINQEYRIVLSLIAENDIKPKWMIDCGSNIGITSLYFLNRFPGCSLVCVEADRRNFEQLKINLEEQENVHFYHRAIWHESNHLLSIGDSFRDGMEWSKSVDKDQVGDEAAQVNSISIRELIDTHEIDVVDFLKIDIEGAEHEIFLSAAPNDFLAITRFIAVEIHDEVVCRKSIHQVLKDAGFTIFESGELTVGINRRLIK